MKFCFCSLKGSPFNIFLLTIFFRFLLQFTITGSNFNGNGQLDVVETNPFKHLIHLSLKFLPGNDEEVKKYLASCIKILKVNSIFKTNIVGAQIHPLWYVWYRSRS